MLNIRPATPEDAAIIHGFVYELAEFERSAEKVELTVGDYEGYLQEGGHFNAFIAEVDGVPAGMALWYKRFSTWVGDYVHLEDLYVKPEQRRLGIAKSLIRAVGNTALEQGMKRMEWMVLDWNENAIKLYESLGASVLPDWRLCMVERDGLSSMAASRA